MRRDDVKGACADVARSLIDMRIEHLDAAMAIERAAYSAPWTRGNFVDSIDAGCLAWCLFGAQSEMLGYIVAMPGAGEMHLLNLTVGPAAQRQGHARHMLDRLIGVCMSTGIEQLWLEVRASNQRARELYRRFGFVEVGLRKGYYPANANRAGGAREDAVAMTYRFEASDR